MWHKIDSDLPTDEMPFINCKIGNTLINFEDSYSRGSAFAGRDKVTRHWGQKQIFGRVGDQPIKKSYPITMLWETGYADKNPTTMEYCNYEGTECYESMTIPVIYEINQATGYTTGGQVITIDGFGFSYGAAVIEIDGTPCTVISQSKTQITCRVNEKGYRVPLTEGCIAAAATPA